MFPGGRSITKARACHKTWHPQNEALPKSAFPITYVPAPALRDQGLEILIASVNGPDAKERTDSTTPSGALLSPILGSPILLGGRQSLIRQPVHRAMLVARRVNELLGAAELLGADQVLSRR